MHDNILLNFNNNNNDIVLSTPALHHIICDLQLKDLPIPYPSAPSPVESDLPFFSAGSSTMSHSSMSPSVCDLNDDYPLSHLQSSSASHSLPLDSRKPILAPLAIDGTIRHPSPWSALDASDAYTDFRRASLPSIKSVHPSHNSRPVTAPLSHIYQPSWSDHDDGTRFAYSAYGSSVDDLPLSSFSSFPSAGTTSQTADFLYPTDDSFRSRPATGEEYPAYIPDCQETVHVNPSQTYTVDPSAISAHSVSKYPPETKQAKEAQDPLPQDLSTSPTTSRRRTPVRTKSKGNSPIIETYKNGVIPPIKRRGKLPKSTTELLKTWLYDHAQHPYPTEEEKRHLCAVTGLTFNQVSNWMINARRRILPTRNNASVVMVKPSSPRGDIRLPSTSSEQFRRIEHPTSSNTPLRTGSPTLHWSTPASIHAPVPNTYYATVRLDNYSAAAELEPVQQQSNLGCTPSSDFFPAYGFSAGGNPFNYHGSIDGNILSRSIIDTKPYTQQVFTPMIEQNLMVKRER